MREVFIEVGTQVIFELLMLLVGILLAYLSKLLAKTQRLEHVSAALEELEKVVRTVVGELQQTTVDILKAQSADGKLSKDDIDYLGHQLIDKVAKQISAPAAETLYAAGVDVEAMIHSFAEAYIAKIKRESGFLAIGEAVEFE